MVILTMENFDKNLLDQPEKEENQLSPEELNKIGEEYQRLYQRRVRAVAIKVFRELEDQEDRESFLKSRMQAVIESGLIDDATRKIVYDNFNNAVKSQNQDDFVNKIAASLGPIIEAVKNNPIEFEKLSNEVLEKMGQQRVNDLIYFGIDKDNLHIHAPAAMTKRKEIPKLLEQSLKEIALTVKENENIQIITAQSWIITRWPYIFINLGFAIDDDISRENRIILIENGVDLKAHMTREEFLKRFLKK
jgi:hypothetical protein